MTPSRRVGLSATLWSAVAIALILPGRSGAQVSQYAAPALSSAGLSLDALSRSPGLVGMGMLTLVGDDPHHRITLWDFAGNPAGVAQAESTTTVDVRPGAGGASDVHNLPGSGRIREWFATHLGDAGYEFWRRQGQLAYGAIGDLSSIQSDAPYSDDVERRRLITSPTVTPVLNGVLPFTHSGRTRYAFDIRWGQESVNARYLTIVRNAAGDFISLDSEHRDSPLIMVPESFDIQHLGGGASLSQVFGSWLTAAIGYDGVAVRINGDDADKRNEAQTYEMRPYNIGQATLLGRVGKNFEWGVDGRGWRSTSQADWNFTISAGQGVPPLTGRGKLLARHEQGTEMHARALWHAGAIDFGGGWNTDYREVKITPPDVADHTSFNYFLNTVFDRLTADSLALPDSVSRNVSALHGWEAGGGAAWHLPNRRGTVGAEYHRYRDLDQSDLTGLGPRSIGWDVRGGAECVCTPALRARLGYQFRWDDLDDYTQQNEYRSHVATAGFGVAPKGSMWTLDLSYAVRWLRADFGTPDQPRGNRQQVVSQVHWVF